MLGIEEQPGTVRFQVEFVLRTAVSEILFPDMLLEELLLEGRRIKLSGRDYAGDAIELQFDEASLDIFTLELPQEVGGGTLEPTESGRWRIEFHDLDDITFLSIVFASSRYRSGHSPWRADP